MPSFPPYFPLRGRNSRSINVTNRSLYHFEGTPRLHPSPTQCKVGNNTSRTARAINNISMLDNARIRVNHSSNFELQRQWPDCVPSLVNIGVRGGEGVITNKVSPPWVNDPYCAFLLNYRTVNYSMCVWPRYRHCLRRDRNVH